VERPAHRLSARRRLWGRDTVPVLSGVLGYDAARIDALRDEQAIQ
jgi:hypothetical protein